MAGVYSAILPFKTRQRWNKPSLTRALDFAREIGGARAVARIRTGMARFAIRSFTKLECDRPTEAVGYLCRFAVDIETAGGSARRTLTCRFTLGAGGLTFAHEDVSA